MFHRWLTYQILIYIILEQFRLISFIFEKSPSQIHREIFLKIYTDIRERNETALYCSRFYCKFYPKAVYVPQQSASRKILYKISWSVQFIQQLCSPWVIAVSRRLSPLFVLPAIIIGVFIDRRRGNFNCAAGSIARPGSIIKKFNRPTRETSTKHFDCPETMYPRRLSFTPRLD